jgi:hypothetical protein
VHNFAVTKSLTGQARPDTYKREMIPLVSDDDRILAQLRGIFGRRWSITRTRSADGMPHWWKAVRRQRLTDREIYAGLSMTVIEDSAADLRKALEGEGPA